MFDILDPETYFPAWLEALWNAVTVAWEDVPVRVWSVHTPTNWPWVDLWIYVQNYQGKLRFSIQDYWSSMGIVHWSVTITL
jgi:hypothetical protein